MDVQEFTNTWILLHFRLDFVFLKFVIFPFKGFLSPRLLSNISPTEHWGTQPVSFQRALTDTRIEKLDKAADDKNNRWRAWEEII